MRFESLLWTVLAVFMLGSAAFEADTLVGGVSGGGREYQATDGGQIIPPPIVDPGSSTTAPAPPGK